MMEQSRTDAAVAVLQQQARHAEQQFARSDQVFMEIRQSMDGLRTEIHRVNTKLHWVIGAVTIIATIQLLTVRLLLGS